MSTQKAIDEILVGWDAFDRPKDGQRFRHYKGGEYQIVATGFIEESEVPCVVYRSQLKNIVWVRTAQNFFETVNVDGEAKPRFTPIKS